jgi:hypothetical protein
MHNKSGWPCDDGSSSGRRGSNRRLDRGLWWLFGGSGSPGFGFGSAFQLAADFVGHINGNRTGVCFLFGYAKAGQKVDDGLGFDLEFTRQFVNSDLSWVTHASLRIFLFLLSLRMFFRRLNRR